MRSRQRIPMLQLAALVALCALLLSAYGTDEAPGPVSGLPGEATVANLRAEPITLWGCHQPFEVEEQIEGRWQGPAQLGFQPAACDPPLWLEAGEEVTFDFDPGVAPAGAPGLRRLVFTIGSRCQPVAGAGLACDHFERLESDSFTVQPGDPGRALTERARARGGLPVIYFAGDAALPDEQHVDAPGVARLLHRTDVAGLNPAWQPPRFRRASAPGLRPERGLAQRSHPGPGRTLTAHVR